MEELLRKTSGITLKTEAIDPPQENTRQDTTSLTRERHFGDGLERREEIGDTNSRQMRAQSKQINASRDHHRPYSWPNIAHCTMNLKEPTMHVYTYDQ